MDLDVGGDTSGRVGEAEAEDGDRLAVQGKARAVDAAELGDGEDDLGEPAPRGAAGGAVVVTVGQVDRRHPAVHRDRAQGRTGRDRRAAAFTPLVRGRPAEQCAQGARGGGGCGHRARGRGQLWACRKYTAVRTWRATAVPLAPPGVTALVAAVTTGAALEGAAPDPVPVRPPRRRPKTRPSRRSPYRRRCRTRRRSCSRPHKPRARTRPRVRRRDRPAPEHGTADAHWYWTRTSWCPL